MVRYGNRALRTIPYEEWGLKSVPTLSARRREEEILGKEKHHLIFPESMIPIAKAPEVLHTLATERAGLHRSRMMWCFVGMPITAPLGLLPVIPNLPFFYLAYRAWSHYRALAGGKHLQWLLSRNFFTLSPSDTLDAFYPGHLPSSSPTTKESDDPGPEQSDQHKSNPTEKERMLLTYEGSRELARALEIPALEIELERAIWQVENAIRKQNESSSASSERDESKSEKK